MKGLRKISSVLLLVLYATFFVSTNLCTHSHDIFGHHIVHSHLGGGAHHSHSADQIQTINILNTECFVFSVAVCELAGQTLQSTGSTAIYECGAVLPSKSESHS